MKVFSGKIPTPKMPAPEMADRTAIELLPKRLRIKYELVRTKMPKSMIDGLKTTDEGVPQTPKSLM